MKHIKMTDKSTLKEIIDQGGDEEVPIERDGHAVALVVPFDDQDREWYARERDTGFKESIARAREQIEKGQTITHEQLKAEMGRSSSKGEHEELSLQFHEAMLDIYRQAKRQLGYNATRFLQMVTERGGLRAAHDRLATHDVSEGFTELSLRGNRLDLSVEFLVLRPAWRKLFTDAELVIARKRLTERHFSLPTDNAA